MILKDICNIAILPIKPPENMDMHLDSHLYYGSMTKMIIPHLWFCLIAMSVIELIGTMKGGTHVFSPFTLIYIVTTIITLTLTIYRYCSFAIPLKYWKKLYFKDYDVFEHCSDFCKIEDHTNGYIFKPNTEMPLSEDKNGKHMKVVGLAIALSIPKSLLFFDRRDSIYYKMKAKPCQRTILRAE